MCIVSGPEIISINWCKMEDFKRTPDCIPNRFNIGAMWAMLIRCCNDSGRYGNDAGPIQNAILGYFSAVFLLLSFSPDNIPILASIISILAAVSTSSYQHCPHYANVVPISQIAFQIVLTSARCQRCQNYIDTTLAQFGMLSGQECYLGYIYLQLNHSWPDVYILFWCFTMFSLLSSRSRKIGPRYKTEKTIIVY